MVKQYERTSLPRTIVRAEASSTADVVATVPEGTELEILSVGEAYIQVSVWLPERGHVTGYVECRKLGYEPVIQSEESRVLTCTCGASAWRTVPYRTGNGYTPYIVSGFLSYIRVETKVCMACGHLAQCVDREGIEKLRSTTEE